MNEEELSLGPMIIIGHYINVKVYTTEELTEDQKQQKIREIHSKMASALPRYQIDVDLDLK
ncbi:hypothetical protein [Metabacillus bambusae]|uniref:Uncharacterized protein n=1 Tax=Metabacillus bambusae TaxID=2795218 RepID=A0ABS3N1I9_9BACI|nr:hypothetical protein [Metabacillus bambusae]MBO1511974.1 hypothetical protein [Metabacillus bambusae]